MGGFDEDGVQERWSDLIAAHLRLACTCVATTFAAPARSYSRVPACSKFVPTRKRGPWVVICTAMVAVHAISTAELVADACRSD